VGGDIYFLLMWGGGYRYIYIFLFLMFCGNRYLFSYCLDVSLLLSYIQVINYSNIISGFVL
jgi:hypothetical protein